MSEKSFPTSLSDISSHDKPQPDKINLDSTKSTTQEYTEQPVSDHTVPSQVEDGPNMQVDYIVLILAVVGVVVIKPIREFFIWFIQNVFLPTLVWCSQTGSLWLVWLLKSVINSHVEFFRHLITPRSIIFPSLDDQREESDKKINRKVE